MRHLWVRLAKALLVGATMATSALHAQVQTFAIKSVTPNVLTPGQSLESAYRIDAKFELVYATTGGESLRALIGRNVSANHWDCHDPHNFDVSIANGNEPVVHVKISRVSYVRAKSCSEAFPGTDAKDLQLWVDNNQPRWRSIAGGVTVTVLNLKDRAGLDETDIASKPNAANVLWKLSIVTISAQTANNETLLDKSVSKNAIYQFPVAATYVLMGSRRGGLYANTKDLFATNERDSKSAFQGGVGYQYGLLKRWSIPLKLEEDIQGNQVASNLASQTNLQGSSFMKWTNALAMGRDGPAWNAAPSVTIALPYTRRINQYVTPGKTALPTDDFAVNPSVALKMEQLVAVGADNNVSPAVPPRFALYWEADIGMFYLPLERTNAGSQRAEGTGDVSILIPLTDFGIVPGLTLDQTTQANQMQIRIKYQDSVSATNNYVRTKGWTFGLELSLKK